MVEVGALLGTAWPILVAALRAYGSALTAKVADDGAEASADATVKLGRHLWQRLFSSTGAADGASPVERAAGEAAEHLDDEDYLNGLRLEVKKALAADVTLAQSIEELLQAGGVTIAVGPGSVAVTTNNGIISTGSSATIHPA